MTGNLDSIDKGEPLTAFEELKLAFEEDKTEGTIIYSLDVIESKCIVFPERFH
jgi:hypothetical protein